MSAHLEALTAGMPKVGPKQPKPISLPEESASDVPQGGAENGAGSPLPVVLSAQEVHTMMRQLRDCRSRIDEEIATCDADRAKLQHDLFLVDEHQERVTKEDRERAAFLEGQLQAHLLNLRATDDRIKSVQTPWGDISSRAQAPEYVKDEAALLDWAQSNQEFLKIRTVATVDWERLKKVATVNAEGRLVLPGGEIVPGVEVNERSPKAIVEVVR